MGDSSQGAAILRPLSLGLVVATAATCSIVNAPEEVLPQEATTTATTTGGGGTTTSTATTGTGGSTSSPTSTGQGAGGTGGFAATTTGTAGSGGAPLRDDGDACEADAECSGGLCASEIAKGLPKGMCGTPCAPFTTPTTCPSEEFCAPLGIGLLGGQCVPKCDLAAPNCRPGYQCTQVNETDAICAAHCTEDDQCKNFCNLDRSVCYPFHEDCRGDVDLDRDNLRGCQDTDCFEACADTFAFYCEGATALVSGSYPGDTNIGDHVFYGSCTGLNARERVYTYTPPANGTLTLQLDSATDQGVYIRSTCAEPATEFRCADLQPGGMPEFLETPLVGGTTYYVFVDGYGGIGAAGPYTLTVSFTPN